MTIVNRLDNNKVRITPVKPTGCIFCPDIQFTYRNGEAIGKTDEAIAHYAEQTHGLKKNKRQRKSIEGQLTSLLVRVVEWSKDNSAHIFVSYLTLADSGQSANLEVHFFAVQNDNVYDAEFSRSLTRLEIEIENSTQFSLIRLKVMELPSTASFLILYIFS